MDQGLPASVLDAQQLRLVEIGRYLDKVGYRFTTTTPETHRRNLYRPRSANLLSEMFGWSRLIPRREVPEDLLDLLDAGDCLDDMGSGLVRCRFRFSSLDRALLVHSHYPTTEPDAVFFGPDTYRFCRCIDSVLDRAPEFEPSTIVDLGCGTGAGGIRLAARFPDARVLLADINDAALRLAQVNVQLNAATNASVVESDVLIGIRESVSLIVANPPYLVDPRHRAYRDGGGDWGVALSVRILAESIRRLTPEGRLILYTGTPVVGGHDMFRMAARPTLKTYEGGVTYEEVDPDVFGEELGNPPYDRADRIAAVLLALDPKAKRQ